MLLFAQAVMRSGSVEQAVEHVFGVRSGIDGAMLWQNVTDLRLRLSRGVKRRRGRSRGPLGGSRTMVTLKELTPQTGVNVWCASSHLSGAVRGGGNRQGPQGPTAALPRAVEPGHEANDPGSQVQVGGRGVAGFNLPARSRPKSSPPDVDGAA